MAAATAPVVAILAIDLNFPEPLRRLFPLRPG